MAFKIEKRDSYRWTVEHVLSKKNGVPDEMMKLDFEFKALPSKEADEVIDLCSVDPKAAFARMIAGWHDAPPGWEFSLDKFWELLEAYPGMSGSVVRAYIESITGQTAARKN